MKNLSATHLAIVLEAAHASLEHDEPDAVLVLVGLPEGRPIDMNALKVEA